MAHWLIVDSKGTLLFRSPTKEEAKKYANKLHAKDGKLYIVLPAMENYKASN